MTRLDPAADAIIRLAENWAANYTQAKTVFAHDIEALDWHPSSTLGDGTPHGTSDDTPVERCVLDKDQIAGDWTQCEDDRKMLAELLHSAGIVARRVADIARREKPDRIDPGRCKGKINEQCHNAPADNLRDRTGSPVLEMCEQCYIAACPGCYERPAEAWRKIVVGDHKVSGCEACYRRQLKAARVA